ncbi:SusC/RagA family TonB-linked outer membrane protein [Mucilaginibacter lappiensis]|uniref:TonB-linked SusC/RagA family outer membrane protein n=1 Tax=Mucilaginibacter lappiensis TaxID=354630 RepID=A0A1N6PNK2_9SPHI|nr:SusC/RagA family TonB-linked outer membrane protein [Mucilaginibacter lappiensis]MBB6107514.1 TonB-linked SusC/RagA family outer membrane protein [Mucilaginibacter lappiensis]MBB6126167.1 TonB-linked SusC/RagA family outer membrane protein [Mucilaginibacter lappiensis]SIQ05978.1 TonB-linked outer membrane protein, SusC/RagA family [Mucilaginibacter lappiensis]
MKNFYLLKHGLLLVVVWLLTLGIGYAQSTIEGKVSDESGPIPGVVVSNKSTGKGTASDLKGGFRIAANAGDVLEFKSLGYLTRLLKIEGKDPLTVLLKTDSKNLNEVVVTALGIKKEKSAVGYAIQEVKGDALTKAREPNPVISLTGKVAGLLITPSSNLFGNPGISLRGQTGVLFVVDGTPISTDSWNLSGDDIESYSVLKGANAAALYGSRGANGAIIITTKKGTGSKQKSLSVELNSSTQLQLGYNAIPKIQTSYGPGDNFDYAFKDGKGGGTNDNDYFIWGPRFEGQLIPQYNSPVDPATGNLVPIPWLARGKDNLANFLQNGLISTNNVAVSTQSDLGNLRFSVSDIYQRGTIPNTQLNITNFSVNGTINVSKKVRFESSINYDRQISPNYPVAGYGPTSPVYLMTVWGSADYDVRDLRNYWQPGKVGIQQYSREYTIYNNPWFVAYENLQIYKKDDLYGHVQMDYDITDKLKFNLRTDVSTWSKNYAVNIPVSGNFYQYGNYNQIGGYINQNSKFWENNTQASLSYADKFRSFGYKTSVFANIRTVNVQETDASTNGGLLVPGVYTLSNSVLPSVPQNYFAQRQVNSAYGLIDLNYKTFLYLNLTGRFDKSSTLPASHDTYFYPSASLSVVLSEFIHLPQAISYLKARGSYANIARDVVDENNQYDIYKQIPTYTTNSLRWNNNTGVNYSSTLYNGDIQAARVKTSEVGLEARFFNNRLGFDAAYFHNIEGPGIVNVAESPTSGVTSYQQNAYTYTRKGAELTIDGTPIKTAAFSWNIAGNWSFNHKWLDKIDGVQTRNGMIKLGDRADSYYIYDFQRDPQGNIIVKSNGLPAINPYQTKVGYTDNNFVAGINNTFKYKAFSLSFQLDGRFGGKVQNYVDYKQWQAGVAPGSDSPQRLADWNNRNNPNWQGTVMTNGSKIVSGLLSTDQDGKVISDTRVFAPNNVPVLYENWASNFYTSGYEITRSATYVKLREVILSYNFSKSLLDRTKFIKTASVSFVARNLLYLTGKGTQNIDLDQFTSSSTNLQTPTVKSIGFNLNATF